MPQACRWGVPTVYKQRKVSAPAPVTHLSDDELRQRIFANATALFPSSSSPGTEGTYDIVYGSRPRLLEAKHTERNDEPPWQYAMLVRKSTSGDVTPLMRGQAWSTDAPWSMVLQGLLDVTATAIHRRIGSVPVPSSSTVEDLPPYAPPAVRMQVGTAGREIVVVAQAVS
ncbi:hypothetical protein LTR85_000465 [Meristemomyces frigidus]|nr:hypothetical protein LTR85_000465 [Meristemomyces frigidus]